MSVTDLLVQVFSSAFGIVLPFGFTFGALIVAVWSLPLLMRLIKSIF